MKECIRKTNDEVFGGVTRGLKAMAVTKKGRRTALVMIVAAVLLFIDVGFGTWLVAPLMEPGQEIMPGLWAGLVVGAAMTVIVFIGVVVVIYAVTLSHNCE